MRTLVAIAIVFAATSLLIVPDAEAKRFGGGMSLGKQYSMPRSAPKQAKPAGTTSPQAAAANPARGGGAGRWLGPLAGLAAGGLLASLFFGDAFEGLQVMDLLLIAGIVFGGVMLFRTLRRTSAAAPAAAGAHGSGGTFPAGQRSGDGLTPPAMGHSPVSSLGGDDEAPDWFDGPAFVEGAKTHFIRLQAAWDQADFRDIRAYTTPQLFAELQRERQRLGQEHQFTEVVTLDAELLGVRRDGESAVASVSFSGLIREEERGTADRFHEVWHVLHPWASREGDWFIAGIQQMEE